MERIRRKAREGAEKGIRGSLGVNIERERSHFAVGRNGMRSMHPLRVPKALILFDFLANSGGIILFHFIGINWFSMSSGASDCASE